MAGSERWGQYLEAPLGGSIEVGVLLLVCAAQWSDPTQPLWAPVSLALASTAAALAARMPRWASWALLFLTVSLVSAQRIYVDTIPLDPASDRDECAEAATRAFLAGTDPWGQVTGVGNPITIGPVDTLVLAPVVALFGRIDEAALAFWLVVLGLWAWGDVMHRNGTFPALALLGVSGLFGISHAQQWSLEELFFPMPLFVLAWAAARRGRWSLVGAALAAMILWRLDYALLAAGFLAWVSWTPFAWRKAGWMTWGGASLSTLACAPFVIRPTGLFAPYGPFGTALRYGLSTEPDLSIVHGVLEGLSVRLNPGSELALKLAVGLGALALARHLLRGLHLGHPFWHVALGGLVAHVVIWRPSDSPDYLPMVVLPALFAIAWSPPRGRAPRAPAPVGGPCA